MNFYYINVNNELVFVAKNDLGFDDGYNAVGK